MNKRNTKTRFSQQTKLTNRRRKWLFLIPLLIGCLLNGWFLFRYMQKSRFEGKSIDLTLISVNELVILGMAGFIGYHLIFTKTTTHVGKTRSN
jgi:hypothetical protein